MPAIPPAAVEPVYETLLTACESLVAYRRRYRSDVELDALCDLLLADDTNPRAMAFQLDRITEDLVFLPDRRELLEQRELAGAAYRTVLGSAWLEGGRLDGGRPVPVSPISASTSWCSMCAATCSRWSPPS